MIAAQSELQGLKQIYTDNNVRVRATQAASMVRQQQETGGKAGGSTQASADNTNSDALYPTLRQLPILGVPFADKLHPAESGRGGIRDAHKEQNELAKVEEAKEVRGEGVGLTCSARA